MPVRAICPECGETAVLSNGLPGDLVVCKQCGLEFPVPDSPKPPPLRKPKRPPLTLPPKPKAVGSEDSTPYASAGDLDEPMLPPVGMNYGADEPTLSSPGKPKKKPRPAVDDERFELAPSSERSSAPLSLPAFDDEPTIPTGKQSYGQDIRSNDDVIPLAKGFGSHKDYNDDEPTLPTASRSYGQDVDDEPMIPLAKEGGYRRGDEAAIPLAKSGYGIEDDESTDEKPLPPPKTPAFIPKLDDEPALPSTGFSYGRDLDENEPELPALPPLPPLPNAKRSKRRDEEEDEPEIPDSRGKYGRDEDDELDDRPTRRSSRERRQFDDEDDYEPRQKSKPSKSTLLVAIGLIGMLMLAAGGISAYVMLGDDEEEPNNNTVANNDTNTNFPPIIRPGPKTKDRLKDPPPTKTKTTHIPLPGEVDNVAVGDSGRYIVLKSKNNLSIFESETKKLTSPVKCGEKSLITAGFRSFFVYDPDSNECEVWDFKGTKEKSVASPFSGQIVAISQGNGSDGPILCVVKGEANNNFEIELLDPYSLNPLAVKIPQKTIPLQGPLVARCAALGRAWTIQEQDRKNAKTLFVQLDGEGTLTWKVQEVDSPYVVFGTDGNTAYAKGAFISYENLPSSFPNAITCYFPSSAGTLAFSIAPKIAKTMGDYLQVRIRTQDDQEIMNLDDIHIPHEAMNQKSNLTLDQRFILTTKNDISNIIYLDTKENRLSISEFDINEESIHVADFMPFLLTNWLPSFHAGAALNHIVVMVSRGNNTVSLQGSMPGMDYSPHGVFTWKVPEDIEEKEVELGIMVKGKKEYPPIPLKMYNRAIERRLVSAPKITPKATPKNPPTTLVPKKEPEYAEGAKLVVKAPQARPLTPCISDQAKWDVATPGQIEDACAAGGGRFLILNCADVGKVAIFDTTLGKITGTIPVKAENALVAGSMDHVVVVYPNTNTVERWNLDKLEREAEAKFTSRQKVSTIVMGNAGAGPIILGGPQAQNNASKMSLMFLDLASLKEVRIDKVDGNFGVSFGSKAHLRASSDGSILGAWYDALTPNGLQTVTLQDNSIHGEYVREAVGYVRPTNSRVYTEKGMYDLKGQPTGRREAVVPAVYGEAYLTITESEKGGRLVSVFQGNDDKPTEAIDTLPGFDGRKDPFEREQAIRFLDKRLFLIPGAKILVGIPPQADRLRVVKLK